MNTNSQTHTSLCSSPAVSVVVPIYNEEESIPHLYQRLTEALEELGKPYEIIAADDGSRDQSFVLLSEICAPIESPLNRP